MTGWLGAWRGWRLRRSGSAEARAYRSRRVSTIRAALAEDRGDFAFLAGDSHAELMGDPGMADLATVNGGIGGATAPVYAAEIDRVAFPRPAALAVLFIGSNDIAAIHSPLSARGTVRFARGTETILDRLAARAGRVWIAAIPPVRPGPVYPQVAAAVPVYNAVLADLAAARGLPFLDPFAALREGEGGLAVPGAMADGTHLTDYRPIAAALAAHRAAHRSAHRSAHRAEAAGSASDPALETPGCGLRGSPSPAIAPAHRPNTDAGPGA